MEKLRNVFVGLFMLGACTATKPVIEINAVEMNVEYASSDNKIHIMLSEDSLFFYSDSYKMSYGKWKSESSNFILNTKWKKVDDKGYRDVNQINSKFTYFNDLLLLVNNDKTLRMEFSETHKIQLFKQDSISPEILSIKSMFYN